MPDRELSVEREVVPHADRAGEPIRRVSASTGRDGERVERFRQRVREGAYHTPAMVEQVARRILGSGDL